LPLCSSLHYVLRRAVAPYNSGAMYLLQYPIGWDFPLHPHRVSSAITAGWSEVAAHQIYRHVHQCEGPWGSERLGLRYGQKLHDCSAHPGESTSTTINEATFSNHSRIAPVE